MNGWSLNIDVAFPHFSFAVRLKPLFVFIHLMYRTLVTRFSFSRVYPRVNIHLSTPKAEETTGKSTASAINDEVKFDYINKTGIIQLNKPKALNALSLSMIEQIYPKMKV